MNACLMASAAEFVGGTYVGKADGECVGDCELVGLWVGPWWLFCCFVVG